jgi:hypothetical protein
MNYQLKSESLKFFSATFFRLDRDKNNNLYFRHKHPDVEIFALVNDVRFKNAYFLSYDTENII